MRWHRFEPRNDWYHGPPERNPTPEEYDQPDMGDLTEEEWETLEEQREFERQYPGKPYEW